MKYFIMISSERHRKQTGCNIQVDHHFNLTLFYIPFDVGESSFFKFIFTAKLNFKYLWMFQSHSSALTDEEERDAHSGENGIERTIQAIYAQKKVGFIIQLINLCIEPCRKFIFCTCHLLSLYSLQVEHPTGEDMKGGLYEAMRTELRHAVEEIRMELAQVCIQLHLKLLFDNSILLPFFHLLKLLGLLVSCAVNGQKENLHFAWRQFASIQ